MYTKTAIVYGGAKQALLYFDHIIPVGLGLDKDLLLDSKLPPEFYGQTLPPELRRDRQFMDKLNDLNSLSFKIAQRALYDELVRRLGYGEVPGLRPEIIDGLLDGDFVSITEVLVKSVCSFVADFRLESLPVDYYGDLFAENDGSRLEFVLSLSSLRLVDVTRCSWEQILEFRRDSETRDKLRRLRLFAYENYANKSKDYVEDDILKKIADYDEAVKQWGFETTQSALNMVLNSKLMGGALAGSLVSTLFGAPTIAVATAMGGGILEIGRVALEVNRQRFALRKLVADNPVSYISHAKSKLEIPK